METQLLFVNWPLYLYTEGKETLKKDADHSRLVGSRFNNQGNLLRRVSWVAEQIPAHVHQNLKVYIEALARFSHLYCSDSLKNTLLSELCPWGSFQRGEGKWNTHPKGGKGVRRLIAWIQFAGQPDDHVLSMTSSNNYSFYHYAQLPRMVIVFEPAYNYRYNEGDICLVDQNKPDEN